MSVLYMVASPIGNLGDISKRAGEVLSEVDFVMAEDTRRSSILLNHLQIKKPLKSCHDRTSSAKLSLLINQIISGQSAAYLCDAGTPNISDPGHALLAMARDRGVPMVPIPGPNAMTCLLSVSDLPSHEFAFWGFLPHKKGRQTKLIALGKSQTTICLYESVHRFARLLDELSLHAGPQRELVIGRELTKQHEDIFYGTVAEAQTYFAKKNKGEFVLLVGPTGFLRPK